MSVELYSKLQIGCLSEKIQEVLEDNYVIKELGNSFMQLKNIESLFQSNEFVDMLHNLIPRLCNKNTNNLSKLRMVRVECIMTRFILETNSNGRHRVVDVTNHSYGESQYCYIDEQEGFNFTATHWYEC